MRMVPDRSQYSKRLVDPVCSAEWFLGHCSSHSDVRVRKGASCRSPSWGKAEVSLSSMLGPCDNEIYHLEPCFFSVLYLVQRIGLLGAPVLPFFF